MPSMLETSSVRAAYFKLSGFNVACAIADVGLIIKKLKIKGIKYIEKVGPTGLFNGMDLSLMSSGGVFGARVWF